jgi:carboxynorspermidine decarboxylase
LEVVEARFSKWFDQLSWINFGGGHHITRPDYDVEMLIKTIQRFRQTYHLEVYLEPGEAIALNTGFLVATVLDIVDNDKQIAILNTSATAHMPDVLEMPYRPNVTGAGLPNEKAHSYRLGGLTCLAGDVIGDYSFENALSIGDRLIFEDMAHYTMVKNNCFNGVSLPSIALWDPKTTQMDTIKSFGYEDYRNRLS